ncbi:uncharacterized protein JCM6883_006976 [Sporobolomyces salmoneus]|uniref:uncharacterized protein n=1 Tax=Sporobolomyces salmoneus TaxID=183962 RepID=UPI003170AA4A
MPSIADSVTFHYSGKTAPTATLKSAMTERLCSFSMDQPETRGRVSKEYIKLYEEWGKGKIGVIVLGNIPIDYEGLEARGNIIIDERCDFDPVENLKEAIKVAKAHGSIVIGQLTHGGRQTSTDVTGDKAPVSASDVQCPSFGGMEFNKPRPLEVDEIKTLVQHWAHGAEVLYKAGADGMQLHGAHGYLLSQFLSARTNKRTDNYGGNFENRMRIVFECLEELKKRVPKDFILSMKLNSADFAEDGMTAEESAELCTRLDDYLDIIELSGGTYESITTAWGHEHNKKASTVKREAFFIEFADNIRPRLKKAKLCVTGGFRSKKAMDEALEGGSVQIVGLARPLTAEPYLIRDMIDGKTDAAKPNLVPAALQTPASVAQIGAIGKGTDIPDLSKEEAAGQMVEGITGQKPEQKPVPEQNTSASYEKSTENGNAKI